MAIAYDPSIASLIHPERHETVFAAGVPCNNLQLGVEAARLAYYRAEDGGPQFVRLKTALGLVNYSRVQHFTTDVGTQAFAAYDVNKRAALVAFRGTQPDALEDIGVDAGVLPIPLRGAGQVHAGFLLAFESIRPAIARWLETDGKDRQTLMHCGHSLGGALATIAASVWRPTQLITLGSPRVGDIDFVNSIAGVETHRIVNCCDLVARVPPRAIYEHTQGLVFIAHDATLAQDHSAATIDRERHLGRGEFFARHALRRGNAPTRDFADHAPVNYQRAFF